MKKLMVKAFWDEEAEVWVAESEDVPGLVTEAGTMEALISKLKVLIPELLEANGLFGEIDDDGQIPFHLLSERIEKIQRLGHV